MDVSKAGPSFIIQPSHSSHTPIKGHQPTDNLQAAGNTTDISHISQNILKDFEASVSALKETALSTTGQLDGRSLNPAIYIDTGRYNQYLVSQQVDAFQEKYGGMINTDQLSDELIRSSGIVTENPLKGSARQEAFPAEYTFSWLKEKDVQSLTDIYIHAREQGLSEDKVQGLASFMGTYRSNEAQRPAMAYASTRAQSVKPEDLEQAKSIYSSQDAPVTQLDKGFLDHILNPDKNLNRFAESVGLDFLEGIVGSGDGNEAFRPTLQANVTVPAVNPRYWSEIGYSPSSSTDPEEEIRKQIDLWLEHHTVMSEQALSQLSTWSDDEQSLNILKAGFDHKV